MGNQIQFWIVIIGLAFFINNPVKGQQNMPDSRQQIWAAISAAPENLQTEATVLGYNADTTLSTLREGTNNLICIADDPRDSEFHVACYHEDLESFMKRGRELKAKGMSRKEVDLIRRSEIKSGKLSMPEKPMALYSLTAQDDAFDYVDATIKGASSLYVIYVPYATEASTGLPVKPFSKGAPWLMEPDTPWAHIMISTGEEVNKRIKTEGQ